MNPDNIIQAKHLNKTYNTGETQTVAVADISLEIARGDFVAIRGKSGSGKSTLLHILGLLDRPSSGVYEFNGTDTTTLSDEQIAFIRNDNIGFIFQSFHLLPRQTVLENVMLPLVYSSVSSREHSEKATKALVKVDMGHRLNHFPPQLSGGEKQRVAIARALVNSPDLIFADEPTGNLDTKTGEIVMHTISELHKEGHTVILVTHETSTASFARRIITVEDGKLLKDEVNTVTHFDYEK